MTPSDNESSTVGAGTALAVGCIALTLVIMLVGVLILLLTRWL